VNLSFDTLPGFAGIGGLPSEGPKAWLSASPYLQFILVQC
jgi:hypothetical protein